MVPQLTRYLLQFHQVYIPSVGLLRLVQQPATLDVANKVIHPPVYNITFSEDGWLTKHQLWHFGAGLHFDEDATRNALQDAGAQLKNAIAQQPFVWNGVGTFRYADSKISFAPQLHAELFQPVAAERVLREHVQHSVLVGDQVILSDGAADVAEAEEKHRNWSSIAGWAVVILALFFILFYLYQHQFSATASGLQQKVAVKQPAATYQQ